MHVIGHEDPAVDMERAGGPDGLDRETQGGANRFMA
jgi:hypothetical protein